MIVLISRMNVQAANAMAGQHFVSVTPVMAAGLFAHALGRSVHVQPQAVGLFHHGGQLLGESFYGRLQPQQRRGAVFIDENDYSSKNKHALSLQPTASAHLQLSLVLQFDESPSLQDVEKFLRHARFAGGDVLEYAAPVRQFATEEQLLEALRGGYWVVDRSDLVDPEAPLESLFTALGRRPRPTKKTRTAQAASDASLATTDTHAADTGGDDMELDFYEDGPEDMEAPSPEADLSAVPPWLAPSVLGYATTTAIANRAGARDGYLHAFCEPLIGLVQFRSVRDSARRVPWWYHGWLSDHVFLATQDRSRLAHDL